MINLPSDRVLVYRNGTGMLLDLDTIRTELERCCGLAGLRDPELAEDVVDVVHRFWSRQHKAQSMPTLQELERLVVQILVDSGMRDVARMFQDKRQVRPADPGATMVQAAQLQVPDLLARDPFFLDKPVDALAIQVQQALERLKIEQVTEGFVQQLARHLWYNRQPAAQPNAPAAYWLLDRAHIDALVAEHAADVLVAGGIRVRPIGSLFPQLAIDISLLEVMRPLGKPPLTELLVTPAFDLLTEAILALAQRIRQQIAQHTGDDLPPQLPIRIRYNGTSTMMNDWLGLNSQQQARLRRDWTYFSLRAFGKAWQLRIDFG